MLRRLRIFLIVTAISLSALAHWACTSSALSTGSFAGSGGSVGGTTSTSSSSSSSGAIGASSGTSSSGSSPPYVACEPKTEEPETDAGDEDGAASEDASSELPDDSADASTDASNADASTNDPCATAPPSRCDDATTMTVYSPGPCLEDVKVCGFYQNTRSCPGGCYVGADNLAHCNQ